MTRRNAKSQRSPATIDGIRIAVESRADGYVAYPIGMKGVVVGQGDTCREAVADVKSAIRSHVATFGKNVLLTNPRS